jgi:hypothetical protein
MPSFIARVNTLGFPWLGNFTRRIEWAELLNHLAEIAAAYTVLRTVKNGIYFKKMNKNDNMSS